MTSSEGFDPMEGFLEKLSVKGPEPDDPTQHLCATCDRLVPDTHPAEWQCVNRDCGMWFHDSADPRCPHCGTPHESDPAESDQAIHHTVFTVEVFSRGPYEPADDHNLSDLAAIDYAINEGDCIGNVHRVFHEVVLPEKVESELLRIGNDGTFFNSDPEEGVPGVEETRCSRCGALIADIGDGTAVDGSGCLDGDDYHTVE
jgi:hypothetical protein